ncbi:MAG: sensor histidine kinase [Campylobacteraceae bacterium]|nr:sensor histidine kinase [Campylobacteraceae bacterium]
MRYIILVILFVVTLYAEQSKSKHILLLNSYNQSMSWVQNITKSVYDVLEPDKNNYIIHIENMDTKRIYNPSYLKQLKAIYTNKYKNIKFDLILSSDNNAFDFLRSNRNDIFGKVPVSFSGVNFFKDSDLSGYELYTGITEEFDVLGTLNLAMKLKPNTKEIFIINDYLKTGVAWRKTIQERLKGFDKNVKITYSKNDSISNLQDTLKNLSSDTIVLLGAYFKDKDGTFFTYEKIGEILSANSKVPVFCLLEFNLNKGVLGGNVIGGYYQGEAMSKIAKKILDGVPVSSIPVQKTGATKTIFDYIELEKYNINIQDLPSNTLVINKPLSYFNKHKFIILTSFAIISLLMIIIVILLLNIKQKKISQEKLKQSKNVIKNLNITLEDKIHKRTQQLENSNEELQTSLTHLKLTQNKLIESEKMASLGGLVAGVAHEINTPIGIGLTGITYLLEITQKIKKEYNQDQITEEAFKEYLIQCEELSTTISSNLFKTAQLVKSFKQVAVDRDSEEKREFNLADYMHEVIASLNSIIKKANVSINIQCDEGISLNSYPGAYSQLLSNLISNSIEHGFKNKNQGVITINITSESDLLTIIYTDDGIGITKENKAKIFDPFYTTNRFKGGKGLGLNIIYNIVTSNLNGNIECACEQDIGAKFIIILPLELN